jgi:hypothetical protein
MSDGRITREDIIGSPFEEDLKTWRHSSLGQSILADDREALAALGVSSHQIQDVKALLQTAAT